MLRFVSKLKKRILYRRKHIREEENMREREGEERRRKRKKRGGEKDKQKASKQQTHILQSALRHSYLLDYLKILSFHDKRQII